MFALRARRRCRASDPSPARARSRARARASVADPSRGAPRRRRVASAAADASDDVDASAGRDDAPDAVILLFGFHPDEVPPLAELVGALARDTDAGELAVARVAGDALGVTAEFLLDGAEMDAAPPATGEDESDFSDAAHRLPPATRCVLLRGEPANALMPDLKLEMLDAGFAPAVFGAFTPAHAFVKLGAVAGAVVTAHERFWDLGAVAKTVTEATEASHPTVTTAWPGEEDGGRPRDDPRRRRRWTLRASSTPRVLCRRPSRGGAGRRGRLGRRRGRTRAP